MDKKRSVLRSATARRYLTLTLLAIASVAVLTGVAYANWGATGGCGYETGNSGPSSTNCVSLANNKWHAVRFAGLGNSNGWTNMDTEMEWVIENRLDITDMVAHRTYTNDLSDDWAMDNDYGFFFGWAGWVDCPAAHTGVGGVGANCWCRGQYLRINSYHEGGSYGGTTRELAYHELGHTVGLRHNTHSGGLNDSCMRAGSNPPNDFYSPHERTTHINANY